MPLGYGIKAGLGVISANQAVNAASSVTDAWANSDSVGVITNAIDLFGALKNLCQAFTSCFAGETPLLTPGGERRIDTIRAGDGVLRGRKTTRNRTWCRGVRRQASRTSPSCCTRALVDKSAERPPLSPAARP